MKKTITFFCLLFSITLLNAQTLTEGLKEAPSFVFECPGNAVFCFTEDDNLEVGPADNFFGEELELVTKFSVTGSFSQIRFWGVLDNDFYIKTQNPPAVDFRVNIYKTGTNGPGREKKSFTFEDVVPAEILDPDTKREEAVSYFCRYDLNLPEAFAIDGEAFIGITRINNSSPIKVETPTKESFVFVSLGNFDGKYEDSGESYLKGFSPRKSDADSFNHLLSAEKGEVNEWSPVPFKPFFALSSSTPVPVSNFAVYLGMVLVAGFSIFFFRRWMG